MTPLAHKIAKDFTVPLKDRKFHDQEFVRYLVSNEVHYFEATKIIHYAWDLGSKVIRSPTIPKGVFLPAKKTWVEWQEPEYGARIGLLIEKGSDDRIHVRHIIDSDGRASLQDYELIIEKDFNSYTKKTGFIFERAMKKYALSMGTTYEDEVRKFLVRTVAGVMGLLCMINQPQTIRQKSHLPHAGLQRALAHALGMTGKFPLHAWAELFIDTTPKDHAGEDVEARLSGRKCLHWVKSHLRFFSNGEWTIVEEHWRGDPSLGIKQSRYTLTDKNHKLERA